MLLRVRGRLDVVVFRTIVVQVRLGRFLGSNFLGSQKTPTWTARASHSVFVAGFMEIRLERMRDDAKKQKKADFSLSGETVDFFEPETDFSALHDAGILLCVDVERLFVDGVESVGRGLEDILGEESRKEI